MAMSSFKYLIESGMTVMMEGHRDLESWSGKMVRDFGPWIRPFLSDIFHWSRLMMETQSRQFMHGMNCWEFKRCYKERGYTNGGRARVCPAAVESRLNGVHGGTNGGRACWVVDGTLCDGKRQRHYQKKQKMCRSCGFYRAVIDEEGSDLILPVVFLRNCVLDI